MSALTITEILGGGAYGVVCVARDAAAPQSDLALKVLHAHLDDALCARARDEVRMLSRMEHPCLVEVHGMLGGTDRVVIVMERVDGLPLSTILRKNRTGIPIPATLGIVSAISSALQHAWKALGPDGRPMRIIHRDIKPDNILLCRAGTVKLVDFGVARGDFSDREARTISTIASSRGYTAPERIASGKDTPKVDVYSLGLTAFELFTGRPLVLSFHPGHHARGLKEQLEYLAPDTPAPLARQLRSLVEDLCAYDPDDRPDHSQVIARTTQLLLTVGQPDLPALAVRVVEPRKKPRPPQAHPAWNEIRFLEDLEAMVPREPQAPIPPEALTEFLTRPDWPEQIEELGLLLDRISSWDATPFEQVLRSAIAPKWQVWRSGVSEPAIIAALGAMRRRPTQRALSAAKRLKSHPNPRIVAAAVALLRTAEKE